MSNIEFHQKEDAVTFSVHVISRASKSEIAGEFNHAIKVKLKAPPVDGAANDELVRLLSKGFAVSRSAVKIVSGHASKTKRVRIEGINATDILAVLKAKS